MKDVKTPQGQRLFDDIKKNDNDQFCDLIYFHELDVSTFKCLIMKKSNKLVFAPVHGVILIIELARAQIGLGPFHRH